MIKNKDKKDCCGCWACENVCLKSCISMIDDEEGFRYPQVDKGVCIDCHLCEKTCPVINVQPETKNEQHGYLLQITDDAVRKESTSGGSFTAIASWIIRHDGGVYGAAFDYSENRVKHCSATTLVELGKFRNCKYVQSDIGNIYKDIKRNLQDGK